jgi:hypothetical protein
MILTAMTGGMILGTMSPIGGTMTAEETMTVTVNARVTVAATDVATVVTATVITTAAATMKNGITTVDATNATIMTATVDAIAHRADAPGVGGGTSDRGPPGVVRVSFPRPPRIRSTR